MSISLSENNCLENNSKESIEIMNIFRFCTIRRTESKIFCCFTGAFYRIQYNKKCFNV